MTTKMDVRSFVAALLLSAFLCGGVVSSIGCSQTTGKDYFPFTQKKTVKKEPAPTVGEFLQKERSGW